MAVRDERVKLKISAGIANLAFGWIHANQSKPDAKQDRGDYPASALITEAVFNAGLRKYKAEGGAWQAEWICYYFINDADKPSFLVDVTEHYEAKRRALDCHVTQFTPASAGVNCAQRFVPSAPLTLKLLGLASGGAEAATCFECALWCVSAAKSGWHIANATSRRNVGFIGPIVAADFSQGKYKK